MNLWLGVCHLFYILYTSVHSEVFWHKAEGKIEATF